MLFTRAYRDFCREVIGRDFDHAPELIQVEDQTQEFQAQYEATRALYKAEFNADPPFEIWGIAKYGSGSGSGKPRVEPRKKERRTRDDDGSILYDGSPLYTTVDDSDLHSHSGGDGFSGFGGGGEFSGAGSSGDIGGSDAGASDGGGSGCSSGCGGGGCGGGGGD